MTAHDENDKLRAGALPHDPFEGATRVQANAQSPPSEGTAASTADAAPRPRKAGASPTELLIRLGLSRCDLFIDLVTEEPFATYEVLGHRENHPIASARFRQWLIRTCYIECGRAPSAKALADALAALSAHARYSDGRAERVGLRVAEHEDCHYLDLGDEHWSIVEIRRDGWSIVEAAPVRFRRSKGMRALPRPRRGGSVIHLRDIMSFATEDDFTLTVAWLLGALQPRGPYPLLALRGEQGSSKSTRSTMLRSLVDPNEVPLRAPPSTEADLAVMCQSSHVLAFDNLSGARPWFADALCRVATGGGFSKRALYTDFEESMVAFERPAIVNGIDDIATRPDLADRSIVITTPRVEGSARRMRTEIMTAFERAAPGILGGLLDALVSSLSNADRVRLPQLPRMADFAVRVTAAGRAFGWDDAHVLDAMRRSSATVVDEALEDNLVAVALRRFAARLMTAPWRGSATELLAVLCDERRAGERSLDRWPGSPAALTNRLRRLAPLLRQRGVEIDADGRTADSRCVVIGRSDAPTLPTAASSSSSPYARSSRAPPTESTSISRGREQTSLSAHWSDVDSSVGIGERACGDENDDDDDE